MDITIVDDITISESDFGMDFREECEYEFFTGPEWDAHIEKD